MTTATATPRAPGAQDEDGNSAEGQLAVQHTGVMVAFLLKPTVAKALAIPSGEPPGAMHLTLAFLGESSAMTAAQQRKLSAAVRACAAQAKPLTGVVSGLARFNPSPSSEGKVPLVALVNAPGIQAFRAALAKRLVAAGTPADGTFEYTPHITLAYVDADKPLPAVETPAIPLTLDMLTLAIGDEHETFPLTGGSAERRAEEERAEVTTNRASDKGGSDNKSDTGDKGGFTLDETEAMIPTYSPVCTYCVHWNVLGGRTCKAYPKRNSIPMAIWSGANDHTRTYAGDHGITFEPVPDAKIPPKLMKAYKAAKATEK